MNKAWAGFLVAPFLLVGGCGGGDNNPLDIPAKIAALESCAPDLFPKLAAMQQIAGLWQQNRSTIPPNPTGLTSTPNGSVLDVVYSIASCTITMEISFWSPTGGQETINFAGATPAGSLGGQIQTAASQLAQKYGGPGPNPFMLGRWSLSGSGFSGSGTLLGSIGGVDNQNELEYIRTTEANPAGDEPPAQASTVAGATKGCSLTFLFDPLLTDVRQNQDYAEGSIAFTVGDGKQNVTGTITLDSTAVAVIKINGVPGRWEFNLNTFALSVQP